LRDDTSGLSGIWNREHDEYLMRRMLELVRPAFEDSTWEAFHRQVIVGENPLAVAQELNMSLGAVYVAKSRVLNMLRKEAAGLLDS
jgi:hypothetical protein